MSSSDSAGSEGPTVTSSRGWRVAFALLLAGHFLQCVRCFPTWRSIVNDSPIIQVDHALHLYHGSIGSRFLKAAGRTWGYDPHFMAGYPKTPFHDPSAGLADVSLWLAGSGYRPWAYKVGLLVTMLTFPLLLAGGLRLLKLKPPAIVVGTGLALLYYWSGFARTLLDTGLYSFLWGTAWLVMLLGATNAWHDRPGMASWLLLAATATIALFVHPTMGLMLIVPLTAIDCLIARRHGWRWHAALLAAIAVCVSVNLSWILPLWKLWPLRQPGFVFMASAPDDYGFVFRFYVQSLPPAVQDKSSSVFGTLRIVQPLELMLAVLSLLGILRWTYRKQWTLLASLGSAAATLGLLTFAGSLWSVTRGLEPLRFQVPFHLLAAIIAGDFLVACATWSTRRRSVAACSVLLLLSAGWFWATEGYRLVGYRIVRHRPFPVGLSKPMDLLCKWIRANTDHDSRIMIEDQLRLLETTVPESLHWTCLLPFYTDGREFIGGQYQQVPLLHHCASFGDFHLGGRPIESYSPEQLNDYLDRYNVGWIICWSERSRNDLDQRDGLTPTARLPRFTVRPTENSYFIYRVDRPRSFFQQGAGKLVSADLDRIELQNLTPDDGLIVLRYHWLDSWRANPNVPLERVELLGDRVGFIGIRTDKPLENLVIDNP